MKKLGIWFLITLALLFITSCEDEKDDSKTVEAQDDSYWAVLATVTSDSPYYDAGKNGGTIRFNSSGGAVTLNVDCGCEWIADNTATDLFTTSKTNTTLTVTAEKNMVENALEGTITLKTATKNITFATIAVTQTAYGAPEITVETKEWHVPAVGVLTTEIGVISSIEDYTVEVDNGGDWISVEKTISGLTITAEENEENDERSTKVTVTANDGVRANFDVISVIQDGQAYITLSSETVLLSFLEGSTSVSVESNFDWDFSYDGSNGWFSVSRKNDVLTVSAETNDGEVRTGIITLTAGDGEENLTEKQLTVEQTSEAAMILTYTTTAPNTKIQLPLYGTVDCVVNWGDGSEAQTITDSQPPHTYASAGEYDVVISGTVTALYSHDIYSQSDPNTTLTAVKNWGKTGLTNMRYAFYYYSNLASLPEQTNEALADVTSFYAAFYNCAALKEIPDGLFGGCSKATDFAYVFYGCSSLSFIPDGVFDDCISATAFNSAFTSCSSIVTVPSNMFEKCTEVTTFNQTFYACTKLRTPPMFDKCVKAETFHAAFYNNYALSSIPEGMFDNCVAATVLDDVFYGCSSLKAIPEGLFDGCTNAASFDGTFYTCTDLRSIPDGLFDYCTEATKFEFAFYGCEYLYDIPKGLFDNCTKATSFYATFYNCRNIGEIPEGLFAKCTEATNFEFTFYGCTTLKTIRDGLFDECTEATNFHSTFYLCSNLTGIPDGLFDNCTKATSFYNCFRDCSSIKKIPEGLFDNCPLVESFRGTFSGCSSITEIPEGLFDNCPLVNTFSEVFLQCSSITEIPKGLFDNAPDVTTFYYAFRECSKLTAVPEGLFDNCPEVTDFTQAFYKCTALTTVPTGIFSKNLKATNFSNAFYDDSALTGESPYDEIEGEKVHLYERTYHRDIYTAPSSYSNCFYGCTGLSDYSDMPSGWK